MDEQHFSEVIDCKFPYNDQGKALALMDQANAISANAMFSVLHELCRPGQNTEVIEDTLPHLIELWGERVDHPLAEGIVPVARLMAGGSMQSVDAALELMGQIAPFKGQYSALSIAYFSCADVHEVLEAPDKKIRSDWAEQ